MYIPDKDTFFSKLKFIGELTIIVLCILWFFLDAGKIEPITLFIASVLTFISDYFLGKKEHITIEKLEEENKKLTKEIDRTKNQILDEVTGGNSYGIVGHFQIVGDSLPHFQFYIQNVGNYTLYDVSITYFNAQEKEKELLKSGGLVTLKSYQNHKRIYIGNIVPKGLATFGEIFVLPDNRKLDMDFTIILRNGVYHQQFRGRRSTKHPLLMTNAYRLYKSNRGNPGRELIQELCPADFPEEEKDKINWGDINK